MLLNYMAGSTWLQYQRIDPTEYEAAAEAKTPMEMEGMAQSVTLFVVSGVGLCHAAGPRKPATRPPEPPMTTHHRLPARPPAALQLAWVTSFTLSAANSAPFPAQSTA